MNLIKKMEELIKEKLNENVEFDKILSLNILYLKYKMILETKDYGSLYVLKYFCYVLINVISNMFNPENISKILDNLS